ncbi:MAG: MFS transporter [Hyphomicrobiaceae bacterium]|nr:MFS transporter [Hyphomicrobiaceae bacterium]
MREPSRRHVVLALGTTQTLAWGSSFYLPAIITAPCAMATGVDPSTIFGLFSGSLLISGLLGPWAGRHIDQLGGRELLSVSNVVLAAGLVALGLASSLATVMLAFVLLGFGMGIGLYDAAFATLGRLYGTSARSAITGISLMAGFASTIAWPLTSLGVETIGWRATCYAWAAAHICLGLPLNRGILPKAAPLPSTPEHNAGNTPNHASNRAPVPTIAFDRNMCCLAVAFAGIWFVTGAMATHLPSILMATGASPAQAILAASLMGPAQVVARIVELRWAGVYHPLVSARIAAVGHPLAVSSILCLGPIAAPLAGLIHGLGNGVLTIARGTVPLAIYGPQNYGYRIGLLGAPARIAQALAPFTIAVMLDRAGSTPTLILTGSVGLLTMAALFATQHRTADTNDSVDGSILETGLGTDAKPRD